MCAVTRKFGSARPSNFFQRGKSFTGMKPDRPDVVHWNDPEESVQCAGLIIVVRSGKVLRSVVEVTFRKNVIVLPEVVHVLTYHCGYRRSL